MDTLYTAIQYIILIVIVIAGAIIFTKGVTKGADKTTKKDDDDK